MKEGEKLERVNVKIYSGGAVIKKKDREKDCELVVSVG